MKESYQGRSHIYFRCSLNNIDRHLGNMLRGLDNQNDSYRLLCSLKYIRGCMAYCVNITRYYTMKDGGYVCEI